ncbi:hypothetical protein FJZ31_38205 [Candidatus Poribacteria bacterium]|nr:hypothetical protein [Candidatus Poribacteria bacterium]
MEEYFIISESEIEKLLEEAKAEAFEMVKTELKTAIAEIVRKKVESFHQPFLLKEKQPLSDVNVPSEDMARHKASQKTKSLVSLANTVVNHVEAAISVKEKKIPNSPEIEETLKEIEQIKSRIARNEKLLQQAKVQTRESEKVGQSLVTSEIQLPNSEFRGDGLYVYCVTNEIDGDIGEEIDIQGIDGQNLRLAESENGPVFSLSNQGLSAIVSQVPLSEFNEVEITKKAGSGDLSWFEAKSRYHELVIRSVMTKNTVIPMKFCTLYTSEESIIRFLEEHKNELRESLDYFAGKSEWGVKLYGDVDRLAEEKSRQQSNEEIKSKSPGVAYFAKRKRDMVMEKELRQLMHDMSQETYDRLAKCAVESRQNEVLNPKATGKEEPMILNAAYLIKPSELEAFNNELAKIQEEQHPFGYELVVSGPWPPYNFVKSLASR